MKLCFIVLFSLTIYLYTISVESMIFNINYDSNYSERFHVKQWYLQNEYFEGGANSKGIITIPTKIIEKWGKFDQPIELNLLGYISVKDNIILNNAYSNDLVLGSIDDVFFYHTYIDGNNKSMNGIKNIIFNSWDSLTLKNFTINNLANLTFFNKSYYQNLENIHFINNSNLDLNITGKSIKLENITFEMLDKSILNLNLVNEKDNMRISGNKLKIIGDNISEAYKVNINLSSKAKSLVYNIVGIDSEIKTIININNVNLVIDKDILLYSKSNKLNVSNSLLKGNIFLLNNDNQLSLVNSKLIGNIVLNKDKNHVFIYNSSFENSLINFYGCNNKVILHNISSDINSMVNFYKDNNLINIKGDFSGNINFLGNNNKLYFNSAILGDTKINSENNTDLYLFDTLIMGKMNINTKSNGNIYFSNSSSKGVLIFNNNSSYNLTFEANTHNYLGGNLLINKDSRVNLNVKDNAILELNYISNKHINNIVLNTNSNLIINKIAFIADDFILNGNINVFINLKEKLDYYIYAKETKFNDHKIKLSTLNSNLVIPYKNDEVTIVFLKSDINIKNLNNIILENGLFNFKIVYNDKQIILVIKKDNEFIDLVDKYYNLQDSLFSKDNLINLTNYLDRLWQSKEKLVLLDHLANVSGNSKEYIFLLNTIFPVSNSVLYQSSYAVVNPFMNQITNIENAYGMKNKIWSNIYSLNSDLTLSTKNLNLNLKGKGVSVGVNHMINNFWDLGVIAGLSISEIKQYNYDINLFNYNAAMYSKVKFNKELYNTTMLAFSLNNFNISRNVVYEKYSNVNTSKPKSFSFIINNYSGYDISIYKDNRYTYILSPNVQLKLGNIYISNYNENGKEALSIKGYNTFTYILESGINSLLNINFKNYNIGTKIGLSIGYDYNTLKATEFKIKDSILLNTTKLSDFNNYDKYLKTYADVSYTSIRQLYGISLLFSHTKGKLFTNTSISLYGFLKL